jgi:hypothetical protein
MQCSRSAAIRDNILVLTLKINNLTTYKNRSKYLHILIFGFRIMKNSLYILGLALMLFTSCRKDDKIPAIIEKDCPEFGNTSQNSIEIGYPIGMYVYPSNDTLPVPAIGVTVTYDFSIWCKDQVDLEFYSFYSGNSNEGYRRVVAVNGYNTVKFRQSLLEIDTIYKYIDDNLISGTNPVHIDGYNYYSCEKIFQNSEVHSTSRRMLFSEKGDSISASDFYLDYGSILNGKYSFDHVIMENADTIWTQHYLQDYSCSDIPQSNTVYIGFKATINQVIKLGWIRLKLLTSGQIVINETAVQK